MINDQRKEMPGVTPNETPDEVRRGAPRDIPEMPNRDVPQQPDKTTESGRKWSDISDPDVSDSVSGKY